MWRGDMPKWMSKKEGIFFVLNKDNNSFGEKKKRIEDKNEKKEELNNK